MFDALPVRRAMHLFYRLFATTQSFAPTILRLVLAAVFIVHGGQKTVGWMGGDGWSATLAKWTSPEGLDLSYAAAIFGILAELLGALGMLTGFCTRLSALLLVGVMANAIALVHWQNGFLAPKGYEYPLTLGCIALALVFSGGGRLSMDRLFTGQLLPPRGSTVMSSYRMQSIIKG